MPTESELRALLQGDGPHPALDAEHIIRRARARRRPKRIAVGVLGGLAAVGVVVPVVVGIGGGTPMGASDAAPAAEQDAAYDERSGGAGSLATDPYPDCHLIGWDGEAVPSGVELRLAQAEPGGEVALTLVNASTEALHGALAGAPYLALSSGDAPAGWSAAEVPLVDIDLAPGASLTLEVPLDAVGCGGAALAGEYGAAASLGIRLDDGTILVANSIRTPLEVVAAE